MNDLNQTQLQGLLDDSTSTEEINQSLLSNDHRDDSFEINEKHLEHYCSYFEQSNNPTNDPESKCKHEENREPNRSIKQKTCLKCEFKNELMDSLDHLAFLSPDVNKTSKAKFDLFCNELKFNSPTHPPTIFTQVEEDISRKIKVRNIILLMKPKKLILVPQKPLRLSSNQLVKV